MPRTARVPSVVVMEANTHPIAAVRCVAASEGTMPPIAIVRTAVPLGERRPHPSHQAKERPCDEARDVSGVWQDPFARSRRGKPTLLKE
jgi:hypothetical protein